MIVLIYSADNPKQLIALDMTTPHNYYKQESNFVHITYNFSSMFQAWIRMILNGYSEETWKTLRGKRIELRTLLLWMGV